VKRLGFGLFTVGLTFGIVAGARVVEPVGTWPPTTWLWLVNAVIAAIGVTLWRMGVKQAAKADAQSSEGADNPFTLLSELVAPAKKLGDDMGTLDQDAVMSRVDELLDTYVLPFAQVRHKVIDRLGMARGSEILVTIAYGERMLNRTWSAASDEHLPEAQASAPEAIGAFIEAQRLAETAIAEESA
jgi:hypothetical protein